MNVSVPTKGSVAILKASAENGESSSALRRALSPFSISPSIALTSVGEGKYSTTASNIAWTPLFLNAEPPNTGTISLAKVLILRPCLISASVKASPSRYFSISSSVASAAASTKSSCIFWQSSSMSSGMAEYSKVIPWSSSLQRIDFIFTRSTTPLNFSSAPIANCNGTGNAPRRSLSCSITNK